MFARLKFIAHIQSALTPSPQEKNWEKEKEKVPGVACRFKKGYRWSGHQIWHIIWWCSLWKYAWRGGHRLFGFLWILAGCCGYWENYPIVLRILLTMKWFQSPRMLQSLRLSSLPFYLTRYLGQVAWILWALSVGYGSRECFNGVHEK